MRTARRLVWTALLGSVAPLLVACGEDGSAMAGTGSGTGAASSTGGAGVGGSGGSTGSGGSGAYGGAPACGDTGALIDAYSAAHPGQDGDINAKSAAEIAADPEAQKLLALCGSDQRPLVPALAWEYGGNDHAWIDPAAAALFYCVYIPVAPSTEHWEYDATADHVGADVSIGCPELNPCAAQAGADQVLACLGDPTNIEIFVDLASLDDGAAAGLSLSEASTDLYLLMQDATKVHLYTGL